MAMGDGYTSVKPVLNAIEDLIADIKSVTPVTNFDRNRKRRILAVLDATARLLRAECAGGYGYSDYYCFQFNEEGHFDQ